VYVFLNKIVLYLYLFLRKVIFIINPLPKNGNKNKMEILAENSMHAQGAISEAKEARDTT